MKHLFFSTLIFVSSLCLGIASPEVTVPLKDIRDVLTSDQFHRSGLDKLSDSELKQLSGAVYGWRKDEIKSTAPKPDSVSIRQERVFGEEQIAKKKVMEKSEDTQKISSAIDGPFLGWKGNTLFKLRNGQVWKQIDDSQFSVSLDFPEIEITKGFLGSYFLIVDGYGSRCKVKRLK